MDFVGPAVADMVTDFTTNSGPIIVSGLAVVLTIWGVPKLIGLFRKVS